jgi:hypothetical protein
MRSWFEICCDVKAISLSYFLYYGVRLKYFFDNVIATRSTELNKGKQLESFTLFQNLFS